MVSESIDNGEIIAGMDEDKYEDAGELEMNASQQRLYLTRLPKILWDALSNLHDEDEIRVGTLRVEGDRFNPSRVSLMLDHSTEALRYVPKEFNMRSTNRTNSNTFVFSERNLPGFTKKHGRTSANPSRQTSQEKNAINKNRFKGFRSSGYRKAIPKKTALVGYVQSEFNCLPIENEHFSKVLEQRARNMPRPKHELQLLEGNANLGVMAAGTIGANGAFNTFIKGAPQQPKKQQQKAIRLPKNELRDLLFECFRSYKYWFIRDLKTKTQQPEPWLRECLDDVAELVRQGPQANTWRLKPSSTLDPAVFDGSTGRGGFETAEESIAPRTMDDDGEPDYEDELDIKHEEGKISG